MDNFILFSLATAMDRKLARYSEPDAVNILLDPGMAFGTGTHPTTAMCLEWLDAM